MGHALIDLCEMFCLGGVRLRELRRRQRTSFASGRAWQVEELSENQQRSEYRAACARRRVGCGTEWVARLDPQGPTDVGWVNEVVTDP